MGKKKGKKGKGVVVAVTAGPSHDVEHEGSGEYLVATGESTGVRIVEDQEKNLARSLSQRHIQMIALAGAIVSFFLVSRDRN
jgi:amino acid permease